ncbi:TetR family transcriptional regulator [Nocardia sp. ET3-3]|uniref:TetR family transcriptional regulator n=1 Tax=Nocardia terrae TaxID=2675851 RepID=A0A7K1V541_9NOCA|nr:TetR/AcrR family transcriptional regulator [Nocardia terrae]MVU81770.1 TetR family transcriptional regulator [Nocardia terrae]
MTETSPAPTVWARRPRRERPGLSVERIVAEAVSLMDAEGIEALTMRALGARLGAGATSMYRHVANRDELLELAVDLVYAEIEVPQCDNPEGWRAALTGYAQSMRSMVVRHGWIAAALPGVGLYYLGPNMLRLNNSLVEVFLAAGFPMAEINIGISTVLGYVVGMSAAEASWLTKVARCGKSEQELVDELWPVFERAISAHPRVAESIAARSESIEARAETDLCAVRDAKFRYGLDRLLDGLQTRLTGPAR